MSITKRSKKASQTIYTTLPAELIAAVDSLSENKTLTIKQRSIALLFITRIFDKFIELGLCWESEYLPIYRSYFKTINKNYDLIINPLKAAGILQVIESYKVGDFPKSYRINPVLITLNEVQVHFTTATGSNDDTNVMTVEKEAEIMQAMRLVTINKTAAEAYLDDYVNTISSNEYRIINHEDIDSNRIEVFFGTNSKKFDMTPENAVKKAMESNKVLFLNNDRFIIDTEEAFLNRRRMAVKYSYKRSINKIVKGFIKPRKSIVNHRESTVLTNTPNKLLQFVTVQGERLVSNDLKNCQFVLLAYIIKGIIAGNLDPKIVDLMNGYEIDNTINYILQGINSSETRDNLNAFINEAEAGNLYEFIEKELGIKDRDTTKDMMYSTVFSSYLSSSSNKAKFKTLFPTIVELTNIFKKENDITVDGIKKKGSLPILLQKVEAYVFTDRIYYAIKDAGIWFGTKHDEVLCKESDAARVKQIIENTLAEIGITGIVKTDKNMKPNESEPVIVKEAIAVPVAEVKPESVVDMILATEFNQDAVVAPKQESDDNNYSDVFFDDFDKSIEAIAQEYLQKELSQCVK